MTDVPGTPVGKPAVSNITANSLTLSWYGPSYDGGSKVTGYRIEFCNIHDSLWSILDDDCRDTCFQVSNLESNMGYQFRISAKNINGHSAPSEASDTVFTLHQCDSDSSNPVSPLKLSTPLSPMALRAARGEFPFKPRRVSVSGGRNFLDYYTLGKEIGKGRFGEVFLCIDKNSEITYAAKFIKARTSQRLDKKLEIEIMNELHHPKLMMLWDAFETPRELIMVMEHVAGGELFDRIVDEDYVLTERECVHFMKQICDGVGFMHSKNIIHLDLKPENVLCISHNSNEIKIIDFGLAKKYNPKEVLKVMVGSAEFVSPEVINFNPVNFAADMWSIGVICYLLLSGISLFAGDSQTETLANVTKAEWSFDDELFADISSRAKEFISLLLVKDPRKRASASDCLLHKWLTQDVHFIRAQRISTREHKKFTLRRKWHKSAHAIRAVSRLVKVSSDHDLRSLKSKSSHTVIGNKDVANTSCEHSSTAPNNANKDIASNIGKHLPAGISSSSENPSNIPEENLLVEGSNSSNVSVNTSMKHVPVCESINNFNEYFSVKLNSAIDDAVNYSDKCLSVEPCNVNKDTTNNSFKNLSLEPVCEIDNTSNSFDDHELVTSCNIIKGTANSSQENLSLKPVSNFNSLSLLNVKVDVCNNDNTNKYLQPLSAMNSIPNEIGPLESCKNNRFPISDKNESFSSTLFLNVSSGDTSEEQNNCNTQIKMVKTSNKDMETVILNEANIYQNSPEEEKTNVRDQCNTQVFVNRVLSLTRQNIDSNLQHQYQPSGNTTQSQLLANITQDWPAQSKDSSKINSICRDKNTKPVALSSVSSLRAKFETKCELSSSLQSQNVSGNTFTLSSISSTGIYNKRLLRVASLPELMISQLQVNCNQKHRASLPNALNNDIQFKLPKRKCVEDALVSKLHNTNNRSINQGEGYSDRKKSGSSVDVVLNTVDKTSDSLDAARPNVRNLASCWEKNVSSNRINIDGKHQAADNPKYSTEKSQNKGIVSTLRLKFSGSQDNAVSYNQDKFGKRSDSGFISLPSEGSVDDPEFN